MKTGIFNILFRGGTLISKFAFVVFIGKYSLDETNLGIFGIFSTSVALLIYVLGFDFYVFNTREILSSEKNRLEKLKNQLIFHIVTYIVIIPFSLFCIFQFDFLSFDFFWLFVFLLIAEHLGQEFYRLFTTLEKSVVSNAMLFVRSGLWVWFVLFDFFVLENSLNLKRYILIWVFLSWISLFIFGILLYNTFKEEEKLAGVLPDWGWILKGAKTAGIFFIGSLSFQIIQFSDRFMIDYFFGKKAVGIYSLYAQFTNAIEVCAFSAVTMVAYPKLIKSVTNKKKYKNERKKFSIQLVFFSLVLIIGIVLGAPMIFKFLDKESVLQEISTFYILIGGIFLLIMSKVYHYDLYVKKKDFVILRISFLGMLVNVILNLILIPKLYIYGAALSTLAAFLVIFVMKFYYSRLTKIG